MRGDKEIVGTLRGFDDYVNMVLDDVTEYENTAEVGGGNVSLFFITQRGIVDVCLVWRVGIAEDETATDFVERQQRGHPGTSGGGTGGRRSRVEWGRDNGGTSWLT